MPCLLSTLAESKSTTWYFDLSRDEIWFLMNASLLSPTSLCMNRSRKGVPCITWFSIRKPSILAKYDFPEP